MTSEPSPPATFLTEGGTWPSGPFRPDAPALTARAARYAAAVWAELERRGWSVDRLAFETELPASWLAQVLRGLDWPDLDVVVRIEMALGVSFFPEDRF